MVLLALALASFSLAVGCSQTSKTGNGSGNSTKAANEAATTFLEALKNDNGDAAAALLTKDYRSQVPERSRGGAKFVAWATHTFIGEAKGMKFSIDEPPAQDTSQVKLTGSLEYLVAKENRGPGRTYKHPFTMLMSKDGDGSWKVASFVVGEEEK
jgi:ketosteroid isomerase-like protein